MLRAAGVLKWQVGRRELSDSAESRVRYREAIGSDEQGRIAESEEAAKLAEGRDWRIDETQRQTAEQSLERGKAGSC